MPDVVDKRGPRPAATYPHFVQWASAHEKPRWNIFKCSKCKRRWAVHNQDAINWQPPLADCVVSVHPSTMGK